MSPTAPGPAPGMHATVVQVVGRADTARALGSGEVDALATPRLIAWLEEATCLALADALDAGQTSVGIAIDITHVRASPVGATIECRASVRSVDGSRVCFAVLAEQDGRVVAQGEVTRAVVDRAAFDARLGGVRG
ncbi:MAG: hypothetical protein KGP12_10300 [Actinomycetales bacterium]|nr:hypothetical protein [Actinomycetales bacterium]